MKKIIFLIAVMLGTNAVLAQANSKKTDLKPRVIVLATGGTIAGSGESSTEASYSAGEIPIEQLLNAVPQIHEVANITGEQISNIGSQNMTPKIWLKLAKRINEIFAHDKADGIVITHGTDTQEETAYFLSLTVQSDNPVVLVGAMRPATALSQDGNRNLLDAVRVAAAPESQGVGTVVAMNEKIFAARDVTKTSTTNVAAFKSRNFGPIGVIHDGQVSYYYKSLRKPEKKFDVSNLNHLPQVEIAYGYAGASPAAVEAFVNTGADGIVFAGVGNGNFNKPVGKALASAVDQGLVVCRSSRVGSGKVTLNNEVDDDKYGFVVADDLNPQKARVLLMLALTKTHDRNEIQHMFFTY